MQSTPARAFFMAPRWGANWSPSSRIRAGPLTPECPALLSNWALLILTRYERSQVIYICGTQLSRLAPHQGALRATGFPRFILQQLSWDEEALKALMDIPSAIREMVVEMAEDIVKKEGAERVSYERYMKLVEEYAPKDVQERFEE